MVILGVLPLYTGSILNNNSGNYASKATQLGRSEAERLKQVTFNNAELIMPPGSQTRTLPVEYLPESVTNEIGDEAWTVIAPPATTMVSWTRTTEIRQYGVQALEDNQLLESEALDGSVDALAFVHFKEVDVRMRLGGRPDDPALLTHPVKIRLRAFRAQ